MLSIPISGQNREHTDTPDYCICMSGGMEDLANQAQVGALRQQIDPI